SKPKWKDTARLPGSATSKATAAVVPAAMPAPRRAASGMYSTGRKRRIATTLLSRSVSSTTTIGHGWRYGASLRNVAVIASAPAASGSGRMSRDSNSSFAVSRIGGSRQSSRVHTRTACTCVAGSRTSATRLAHATCAANTSASTAQPVAHSQSLRRMRRGRGGTYTGSAALAGSAPLGGSSRRSADVPASSSVAPASGDGASSVPSWSSSNHESRSDSASAGASGMAATIPSTDSAGASSGVGGLVSSLANGSSEGAMSATSTSGTSNPHASVNGSDSAASMLVGAGTG